MAEPTEEIRHWEHLERAWILLVTEDPKVAAEMIWNLKWPSPEPDRDPDRAVLRADEVEGESEFNVVAAVYAVSVELLDDMVEEIARAADAAEVLTLRVIGYHPYPPHDADSYITAEEFDSSREFKSSAGTAEKSGNPSSGPSQPGPTGWNPWG